MSTVEKYYIYKVIARGYKNKRQCIFNANALFDILVQNEKHGGPLQPNTPATY
jgi:hypothetical protein